MDIQTQAMLETTKELREQIGRMHVRLLKVEDAMGARDREGIVWPRTEVLRFAAHMERRLRDHDDQGREAWRDMSAESLTLHLMVMTGKLAGAVREQNAEIVEKKAADLANFAMFLTEVTREDR